LAARKEILEQRKIFTVSESGLHTAADLNTVKEAGAKAVLIGESLIKQDDLAQAIANLFTI
jgi:indole-3-glycerol phosphate synthase